MIDVSLPTLLVVVSLFEAAEEDCCWGSKQLPVVEMAAVADHCRKGFVTATQHALQCLTTARHREEDF